ncbi:related to rRNA processing protein [Phialocephala subalpina]|uniref:Ribosomal RNA-processing protein 42 n=1 Tax=Phialocephala subalpina TaxID=576137 RepID=A0A1L7WKF7_9HELO|nr:related to rRNA processing protein [Phialocephala subalpina]
MAPPTTQQVLLSPAELSYLHTSLSLTPPIRPDGRTPSQFRPLIAETGILPGTNGSARICFADGTEAIVGIKAEMEKSRLGYQQSDEAESRDDDGEDTKRGSNDWLEVAVEVPGARDDDSTQIFLAAMLTEALLADREFTRRLWINRRFHWKIYVDILLLSQALSYPLPLLSLTTHLALLSTRLPKLKSELDEDPMFDDDWEASVYLYPRNSQGSYTRPPVTLLVMAVKDNIIFDPSKEELAVAEVVLAVSVGERAAGVASSMEIDSGKMRDLRLLAVRTIDPPSRLTPPGIPNTLNTATGGTAPTTEQAASQRETMHEEGVWQPPRGGAKRKLIAAMIQKVLEQGGVAEEVLDGLDAVELG